jgi:phage regulator Rha-like protein
MKDFTIALIKSEFRVDSRLLAPELNHRHRTILENIDKYKSQFEALGSLPFETEMGTRGGIPVRFALLNEDQCYFLLTLMRNNNHIVSAKLKLVKAFRDARTQLAKRDIARIEGKQVRNLETDAIRDLVEYARKNGSSNAEMYYMTITKMTNSALGIDAGQRDLLPTRKLDEIKIAETMVKIAISDGLNAGLEYKDIYKLCKDRVSSIASVLLN